jgi:glucan phosphoethanolaminetransferase (alkaline phosphatase superfamily)
MKMLASGVLIMEALVVGFAMLVAKDLSTNSAIPASVLGLGITILAIIAAALLRVRWGWVLGWLVQVLVIAAGVVVPTMYFLGVLFAILFGAAIIVGKKGEAARAAFKVAP